MFYPEIPHAGMRTSMRNGVRTTSRSCSHVSGQPNRRRISMNVSSSEQRFDTVVIGGGQSGLVVGYYLARQGREFVILDANDRIGASWRKRWDSLRLFTPARYSSLPGMPFPAAPDAFLTKDAVADYLEAYAARFELPIRLNARIGTLSREGARYLL